MVKFNKILDRTRDTVKNFQDAPVKSTIKGINSTLGAPVKVADSVVTGAGHTINAATKYTGAQWAGKKLGAGYGKSLVKKDPHGQNFGNAFTGFQEGKGMIATAAVGGGLYAGLGSAYAVKMPENAGETSYTGTMQIHNADGVSSAPSLGASGDMVFGMHQGRRR